MQKGSRKELYHVCYDGGWNKHSDTSVETMDDCHHSAKIRNKNAEEMLKHTDYKMK